MPKTYIHNVETNEIIEREMTTEELAQYELDQTATLERIETETSKAAEKQAILAQLGITEDQAKLLLS